MFSQAPGSAQQQFQRALQRELGCGKLSFISPIRSGPLSVAWIVEVERDAKTLALCLKRHRRKNTERINFESQFLRRMRDSGCTLLPEPVPTVAGKDWFVLEQELFSAYILVPADAPFNWTESRWSAAQCRAAGGALAEFHEHSRQVGRFDNPAQLPQESVLIEARSNVQRSLKVASAAHRDAILQTVNEQRLPLLTALDDLLDSFPADGNERIFVHGDYHPGNVLFSGEVVNAIVDMDYVHLDSPLYDVAYGALLFAGTWDRPSERFVKTELLSEFLAGYNNSCAVNAVSGDISAYVELSKFLVFYWLLDLYCQQPDLRGEITVPLLNCLGSICARHG